MLTLYLVCLLVGGLLLGLSLLGGGEAADGFDAGADVEAPELEAGELEPGEAGEGALAAARFLSVRNLVFFAAFFGLTGTLLSLLSTDPAVTLAAAVALGGLAASAIGHLMRYLQGSESGAVAGLQSLEGALAKVVVDVGRERPGKIAVARGDRTHQLVARIHECAGAERLAAGEKALVVRVEHGVAWVAETTFIA